MTLLAWWLTGSLLTAAGSDIAFWPDTPWPLRFCVRLVAYTAWPLMLLMYVAASILNAAER